MSKNENKQASKDAETTGEERFKATAEASFSQDERKQIYQDDKRAQAFEDLNQADLDVDKLKSITVGTVKKNLAIPDDAPEALIEVGRVFERASDKQSVYDCLREALDFMDDFDIGQELLSDSRDLANDVYPTQYASIDGDLKALALGQAAVTFACLLPLLASYAS